MENIQQNKEYTEKLYAYLNDSGINTEIVKPVIDQYLDQFARNDAEKVVSYGRQLGIFKTKKKVKQSNIKDLFSKGENNGEINANANANKAGDNKDTQ